MARLGDHRLGSVDDVVIVVKDRGHRDRLQVAAGRRLSERDPTHPAAGTQFRQIHRALRVRAEPSDQPAAASRTAHDAGQPHPAARELFEDERVADHVELASAVLNRYRHAEHAHVGECRQQVVRICAVALALGDRREHFALDEAPDNIAQSSTVCGQLDVFAHQLTGSPGSTDCRTRSNRHPDMSISVSRPASIRLSSLPVIGPAAFPKMCPAARNKPGSTSSTIGS